MFQEDPQLSEKLNTLYTLNSGDSVSTIAHRNLESSGDWRELADFNGIDIFQPLQVGKQIEIPSINQVKQMALSALQAQLNQSVNDLYKDLDLSGLKGSNPFGELPHQLITWVLR
jgi:hypothetical protein